MACEVRNKEINSQCAELLVRPLHNISKLFIEIHVTSYYNTAQHEYELCI